MKIVLLNQEYLNFLLKKYPNYPNHEVGVQVYFKDKYYFIPLTSQKKEINLTAKNNFFENSKYFILGKKMEPY